MARLSTIKTLSGFDFAFQPLLDRTRTLAPVRLGFVNRCEVLHLLGPHGSGKSRLAVALEVEAVRAGRSVHLTNSADIMGERGPRASPCRLGATAIE